MNKKRIYIIDDHAIVREGLCKYLLETENYIITGSCGDTDTAEKEISSVIPDIVILDLSLENIETFYFIEVLKTDFTTLKVLINTMHEDITHVERAFRSGADGYLVKSEPIENIIPAITEVLNGKRYLKADLANKLLTRLLENNGIEDFDPVRVLSNREYEVFRLISGGFSMGEIAEKMTISIKTVNNHREKIKQKLRITNSRELIQFAISWHFENQD